MHALRRVAGVSLALCVALFGLLAVNQTPVALRFLIWETPSVSLFWWLLLAFVFGLLVGGLSAVVGGVRRRARQRAREHAADTARGSGMS
jgi:uncharacterized integral membrane protein